MIKYFPLFFLAFFFTFCGDSMDSSDDESSEDANNAVNTEKLIGTPFEGLTTGDDFDWDFFLCGDYRTETIDEIPIKIFAAFFTEDEEAIIQEGLDNGVHLKVNTEKLIGTPFVSFNIQNNCCLYQCNFHEG